MRLHPVDNNSLHSLIATPLLILLRFFKSGGPFDSSLPLSIQTLGFWSQLSQSYRNLSIHIPFTSLIQPSRFILANKLTVRLYYKTLLMFLMRLLDVALFFRFSRVVISDLGMLNGVNNFIVLMDMSGILNFKITKKFNDWVKLP